MAAATYRQISSMSTYTVFKDSHRPMHYETIKFGIKKIFYKVNDCLQKYFWKRSLALQNDTGLANDVR